MVELRRQLGMCSSPACQEGEAETALCFCPMRVLGHLFVQRRAHEGGALNTRWCGFGWSAQVGSGAAARASRKFAFLRLLVLSNLTTGRKGGSGRGCGCGLKMQGYNASTSTWSKYLIHF